MVHIYLSDVEQSKTFRTYRGEIRNLFELSSSLKQDGQRLYGEHVREGRNDFSAWIEAVVGDEELALSLSQAKDLNEAMVILDSRIYVLSSAQKLAENPHEDLRKSLNIPSMEDLAVIVGEGNVLYNATPQGAENASTHIVSAEEDHIRPETTSQFHPESTFTNQAAGSEIVSGSQPAFVERKSPGVLTNSGKAEQSAHYECLIKDLESEKTNIEMVLTKLYSKNPHITDKMIKLSSRLFSAFGIVMKR